MKESKDSPKKSYSSWREIAQGKVPKKILNKTLKKDSKYKIAGYVRLSPSDEIREEGSLISHPQQIKNFVQLKNSQSQNWGEIIEWYTDKDYSGGNMNRPAFKKMCKDIISGDINAIIVTELSRLNRNVKDFCTFWDFIQRYNVKLISLKENFDTSTPAGEMMILSIINFAQFERKNIIQRIKNGSRSRAERGLSNGGIPTLGYTIDTNKTCHLIIDEKEKALIELIFNKYLELGTLAKTCHYLNKSGYKTKLYRTKKGKFIGGNRWTSGSLQRILTNLTYIGKREVNKSNRHLNQENFKEADRYKVFDAQWKPIISEPLFYNVQSMLEDNKKCTRKYVHNYRLSGLIYCKECGEKLIGKSGNGRSSKYYYYGHKRKILAKGEAHKKRCILENIPALEIEEVVLSGLKMLKNDKALLKELINKASYKNFEESKNISSLIQCIREELKVIRDKKEGIIDSIAKAPQAKGLQILMEKLEEIENQKQVLENEIESLSLEKEKTSGNIIDLKGAFSLLKNFNKNFHSNTAILQKQLLKSIIYKVLVGKNGVWIKCYGMEKSPQMPLNSDKTEIDKMAMRGLNFRSLSQVVGPSRIELLTPTMST